MRAFASVVLGVLVASVLVACTGSSPGSAPTSTPDGTELPRVQTGNYPATVLDNGDGPELCVGAIAMSYPPQCGGPEIVGWNWNNWSGHYADEMGVKWGEFWVAGTYDVALNAFTVALATPSAQVEWPLDKGREMDFSSPCLTPDGGWQIADAAKTTQETLDEALQLAAELDGYAGAWIDQNLNPAWGSDIPEGDEDALMEWEMSMNDPSLIILNVKTSGDVQATEKRIREVWGGMLCVSTQTHSEAEMLRIQQEISDPEWGVLSSGTDVTTGILRVDVIYDDGTLQQRVDAQYGAGLVEVESILTPWEG